MLIYENGLKCLDGGRIFSVDKLKNIAEFSTRFSSHF